MLVIIGIRGKQKLRNVCCYIHGGDGTFDLKIHAVVVWGGGNFYNLDEMEREMIFYKTMKKNFFPNYSVLEKSVYYLIVAISVELPMCDLGTYSTCGHKLQNSLSLL